MIIATAGHVDHGKTSLVNALTGINTDRLLEEKERGLTIDLGFAYTDTESGGRLGFVDVPGHTRFISNMLAGVSAIDLALLVIAADDGIMPQTREHLEILHLLGINRGIVALTKTDRVDQALVDARLVQVQTLVQGSFLDQAEIFPVSSETGEGIDTLRSALEVVAEKIEARTGKGLFRLAIDRRFSLKGTGMVVTGSVFSGQTSRGDEVFLMPQGASVRVRELHTQNQVADRAVAGDRCAVNLSSNALSLEDIHRGNWLTANQGEATSRADILLHVSRYEKSSLAHWTPVHIHTAANHVTGRVALLDGPRLEPGKRGLAQLVFESAINLCFGDSLIIRDQAATRTLGGGRVIDPFSPKRGRARPERLAWLKALNPDQPAEALTNLVMSASFGVSKIRLQQIFNLKAEEVTDALGTTEYLAFSEDFLVSEAHFAACLDSLKDEAACWHEANPDKTGMSKSQMKKLARNWPPPLLDAVVSELLLRGDLEQQGNQLKRPGASVQLSAAEQKIWQAAEPLLRENPTRPPVLHDLAKAVSMQPGRLEKVLLQVVKTGQLIRPVKNRFLVREGMEELQAALPKAADDGETLTVQQYRDATGIGRNLSIEILEYFDRQGITRRIGNVRHIIKPG